MIQRRNLLAASLVLTLGLPFAHAGTTLMRATTTDRYGESLDQVLAEHPVLDSIPDSQVLWLAQSYGRTADHVVADLRRQGSHRTPAAARPSFDSYDPPIDIPASSWNRQVYLNPEYERRLEGVIEKYHGVAMVPEGSVAWLAKKWNTSPVQVKYDLQRVQRHDPDKLALQGFAH